MTNHTREEKKGRKTKKITKMKKLKPAELRKQIKDAAMPAVKQLVVKFGRTAIQSCLNDLRDYEKKLRKLEFARQEVNKLERETKVAK